MNHTTIIRVPKRRAFHGIAGAGLLFGCITVAVPAYSAELYYPGPYSSSPYQYDAYRYSPEPYYQGANYRSNCSPCGSNCSPCGCWRCGCTWRCGCGSRCGVTVQPRDHVIERRFVEREYYERRYAVGPQHSYRPYGYAEPRSWGYPAPSGYEDSRSPFPYGYAGVRSLSPPGSYDYSDPPRPPAPVGPPGPYYSEYYPQ